MSETIEKLRQLPEAKKKIVFFAVLIVAALLIGTVEIFLTKYNLEKIQQSAQSIKVPSFDSNIPSQTPNNQNPTQ